MKRALLVAIVLGMGWVSASHAVVISWAAGTSEAPMPPYLSAQLVYVSGTGEWPSPTFTGYQKVGDLATGGYAVSTTRVREQDATVPDPTQGRYYVVLFSDAEGTKAAYRSWQYLAFNDTSWDAFTYDPTDPASGVFRPTGGIDTVGPDGSSGWQPIPEPSTFALLAVGAAAIMWKRRRKS